MYLVGVFEREKFYSDNPLHEVRVVEKIDRETLTRTTRSDDFQVINLGNLTYFDPGTNSWKEIKKG